MDVRISPSVLKGHVEIPASKSCAHRALICAALSDGVSHLTGVSMSDDIYATIGAMTALGASFEVNGTDVTVTGITSVPEKADIDCCESGSTLRFIIPIAAALGADSIFRGRGRLPQRPIDIYKRELSAHGVTFTEPEMPYSITGKLKGGRFEMEGNVSSQFLTGLLFALPLLEVDSEIVLTSKLESRPYVDITIDMLRRFGVKAVDKGDSFHIAGGQHYRPCDMHIEGDYSQAAFFCVANAIGSEVDMGNLYPESVQGDKAILSLASGGRKGFEADCSDIPDLVPILSVLAAYSSGRSVIYNAARLKIKESDRLEAVSAMLNGLGGRVTVTDDGLIIEPAGQLTGGTVDSFGDHRIVMAAAIAALGCSGDVVIKGAEAVKKSYPGFFSDYTSLGGKIYVSDME